MTSGEDELAEHTGAKDRSNHTVSKAADLCSARAVLDEDGFVLLPGFLTTEELAPVVAALPTLFPTSDEYHDDVDPERNLSFRTSQFAGVRRFPFEPADLSLMCVNERLLDLSRALLGTTDIRLYEGEAWAKYTGASNYEQDHHRDYGNHTFLVPSDDPAFRQLELFAYLTDVDEEHGPTHVVPKAASRHLPGWLPSADRHSHPALYVAEVSAAGPAGTVLAYMTDTFHRGTQMRDPRGARFTIHLNFRPAAVEWAQRRLWVDVVGSHPWHDFVARATPHQLTLVGWPPPGHPYWTPHTLAGMSHRYPDRDFEPWRAAMSSATPSGARS